MDAGRGHPDCDGPTLNAHTPAGSRRRAARSDRHALEPADQGLWTVITGASTLRSTQVIHNITRERLRRLAMASAVLRVARRANPLVPCRDLRLLAGEAKTDLRGGRSSGIDRRSICVGGLQILWVPQSGPDGDAEEQEGRRPEESSTNEQPGLSRRENH